MKKILVLVHMAQRQPDHLSWFGFRDLVADRIGDDILVEMSSLNQLTYFLDGDRTSIRDYTQGFDIADFDLVVFRTYIKHRDAVVAVSAYCRKKKIPYIDQHVPATGGLKLGSGFVFWEHGLPVPITASGPLDGMTKAVEVVGLPAIWKINFGNRGRQNYLVKSIDEIAAHMKKPNAPRYVLQKFIPNDGDYRVMVLNNKPAMVIKRQAAEGSHLNNTSRGGAAALVPVESLSSEVIDLALQATRLSKVAIAGTDIIIDKETGKPYILEVNHAPQIASGSFADEKLDCYAQALREILNGEGPYAAS